VHRLVLAVLVLAAASAPAYAGGDFLDVAAGPDAVWVAGEIGVVRLDPATGRTTRQIVFPEYPLSVAVGGGAAWVASVAQGYTSGTVRRIDLPTGAVRVVLHRNWSAQKIVVAGGNVWVLLGSAGPYRVARFDLSGRLRSIVAVGRSGGWMTADETGAWVCCHGRTLLHVDLAGRVRPAFTLPVADPVWAGLDSIWVEGAHYLFRLDTHSGRVLARTELTYTGDLAAADGAVYAVGRGFVLRIDARTNRVTARRDLPGNTQAVSVAAGHVWITSVLQPAHARVFRLNPRTLARELTVVLD
jgi:DNA-binding beta-propeller fold protein YncE